MPAEAFLHGAHGSERWGERKLHGQPKRVAPRPHAAPHVLHPQSQKTGSGAIGLADGHQCKIDAATSPPPWPKLRGEGRRT